VDLQLRNIHKVSVCMCVLYLLYPVYVISTDFDVIVQTATRGGIY